jgi:hypothetical protein
MFKDTTWTFDTKTNRYTFDGALGDTYPSIGAGQSVTLTVFVADTTDPAFDYGKELTNYLNESSTNAGTDIRGDPWYHESHTPLADYQSVMVRLESGDDIELLNDWWVVITSATFETTGSGGGPRFEFDLYCLADVKEYQTRQEVVEEFDTGVITQ